MSIRTRKWLITMGAASKSTECTYICTREERLSVGKGKILLRIFTWCVLLCPASKFQNTTEVHLGTTTTTATTTLATTIDTSAAAAAAAACP